VTLPFPLGSEACVEVLPGRSVSAWDALAWFTGETVLSEPPLRGRPVTFWTSFVRTATS
jgi:hypothetical protein